MRFPILFSEANSIKEKENYFYFQVDNLKAVKEIEALGYTAKSIQAELLNPADCDVRKPYNKS